MDKKKWLPLIGRIAILLILLVTLFAVDVGQTQASGSSCKDTHYISPGDTLYKIGIWYGVPWPDIAAANGISYPYTIYVGKTLCIPEAGSTGSTGGIGVVVTSVKADNYVNIKATNLPKKENFAVSIGKCYSSSKTEVGSLRTDGDSGTFYAKYNIPSKYDGVSCLTIYIESIKSSREAFTSFTNKTGTSTTVSPGSDEMYFKILSVDEDSSITIKMYNLVKGKKYKVFIGPAGSGAPAGYLVESFTATANGTKTDTYHIASKFKDKTKLDIRVEGMTITASMVQTFKNTDF
jgi:LysM repeat protein